MTNFNSYNRTLNALNVDRDLDLRVFREKNLSPPEQIPEYAPEGFNIQLNLL